MRVLLLVVLKYQSPAVKALPFRSTDGSLDCAPRYCDSIRSTAAAAVAALAAAAVAEAAALVSEVPALVSLVAALVAEVEAAEA